MAPCGAATQSPVADTCARLELVSWGKLLDITAWANHDRGPYARGRILDLSPRAADALNMKHAGAAAVLVEPLVN
jgi:rare lipoprotein A